MILIIQHELSIIVPRIKKQRGLQHDHAPGIKRMQIHIFLFAGGEARAADQAHGALPWQEQDHQGYKRFLANNYRIYHSNSMLYVNRIQIFLLTVHFF